MERGADQVESMAILFRLNHTLDRSLQYFKSKLGDSASLPVMLTVHKSKGSNSRLCFSAIWRMVCFQIIR